jgi:hypothetical protein
VDQRPGNDSVPPTLGSNDVVVRLLSIGSVVPGKGYDLLIAAVATIADLPWRWPPSDLRRQLTETNEIQRPEPAPRDHVRS